jgi:hypothetical protein
VTGDAFTITYGTGNGGGTEFTQSANGGTITLPGPGSFTPPYTDLDMEFAGWNDGTFTYADYGPYTVTRDVILQARWGFTTMEGVKAYFRADKKDMVDSNILLVVCGDGDITSAVLASQLTSTNVELDLSASTLGETNGGLDLSDMSYLSVQKLILPRKATSIANFYTKNAHEVSGLYVASIGNYAFVNNDFLEKANFPAAITIEGEAFQNCAKLETADFPMATEIGEYAFQNCATLETANFPVATTIGFEAFQGCAKLETADFPMAAQIIIGVFSDCTALETANFPMAEIIDEFAFSGCALTTITIGGGCTINDDSGLPADFIAAYDTNETNAVTYTLVDGKWLKTTG